MHFEEHIFRHAIDLAKRGRGFASPNPEVGAVLVKNGFIIGEGWHKRFGEAHAEANALQDAEKRGFSTEGSELFVTLEPCAHQGKTPSCARLIAEKKIHKVYILFRDPNPLVNGKGIEILQNAGIKVIEDTPVLDALCAEYKDFYEIFSYWITEKKPFFAFKLAQSANGYISEGKKERTILTGTEAQYFTHALRQQYDAILVGKNTVLADNPHLGVRMLIDQHQKKRDPKRILLDPYFALQDQKLKVFRDENFLLVVGEEYAEKAKKVFGKERVLEIPFIKSPLQEGNMFNPTQPPLIVRGGDSPSSGRVFRGVIKNKKRNSPLFAKEGLGELGFPLQTLSSHLASLGIASVLVEGGKKTIASFLQANLVQKGYFFISTNKITPTKKAIRGFDIAKLQDFHQEREWQMGGEKGVEGRFY
jgi:diaminohydroxyphosphoribosylaminopyrimidine deaminase / 5-amino-6-(5-phosphoribosylamino)uracil reductase